MTIVSQLGVLAYGEPPAWLEGQVMGGARGYPRPYPRRCAAWRLSFVGIVGAGIVSASWIDDLGFEIVVELEITGNAIDGFAIGSDPVASPDDVAAVWGAALAQHPDGASRIKSVEIDHADVIITGLVPGRVYTLGNLVSLAPVAQVVLVTVLGDTDGLYRIDIGVNLDDQETASYTASGDTAEDIRDSLLLDASSLDIDIVVDDIDTDKISIAAATAGASLDVDLVSPSGTELAQETTTQPVSLELRAEVEVSPAGHAVVFGRALVLDNIDGQDGVRQVENGDTSDMIAGFVGRSHSEPRPSPTLVDGEPALEPGAVITPIESTPTIALRNAGNSTALPGGAVYVVINDAGGGTLGTCRADADSGNAATPTKFRARWLHAVGPGAVGLVSLT